MTIILIAAPALLATLALEMKEGRMPPLAGTLDGCIVIAAAVGVAGACGLI